MSFCGELRRRNTALLDAAGDTEAALAEYDRGRTIFDRDWVGHFNAVATLMGRGDRDRAREIAESSVLRPICGAPYILPFAGMRISKSWRATSVSSTTGERTAGRIRASLSVHRTSNVNKKWR